MRLAIRRLSSGQRSFNDGLLLAWAALKRVYNPEQKISSTNQINKPG